MQTEPLIEFKHVTKSFGNRTILKDVDLQLYEGEITTIIGKSGVGKTVLLKHIIGLLTPDEGQILFHGKPLDKMSSKEWNNYLGQISYMFQHNALFDSMTVFENIALPLRENTRLSKQEIKAKVMARIEQIELSEVTHKYPSEISGGMQKRTALARAMITDPKIVLFDEMTTGQDPVRRNAILSMIAEYKKKYGFTAVLISHDIPDVLFISDRILALYDTKIVFQGTTEELENFEHPLNDEVLYSIESLQDELTGMYSKRQFKIRYQTDLNRKNAHESYAAIVFTLMDLDKMIITVGHTAAQESIRTMGEYINKHFSVLGGFSARRHINQFGTVLPFSDLDEAERILENFISDFQENGLVSIEMAAKKENPSVDCFDFSIHAGLARGHPDIELDSIMELAEFKQKPIAQFSCSIWRKSA